MHVRVVLPNDLSFSAVTTNISMFFSRLASPRFSWLTACHFVRDSTSTPTIPPPLLPYRMVHRHHYQERDLCTLPRPALAHRAQPLAPSSSIRGASGLPPTHHFALCAVGWNPKQQWPRAHVINRQDARRPLIFSRIPKVGEVSRYFSGCEILGTCRWWRVADLTPV